MGQAYFNRDLGIAITQNKSVVDLDCKEKVFCQQGDGSYTEAWILETSWDDFGERPVHYVLFDPPVIKSGYAKTRLMFDIQVMRKGETN